MKHIGEITRHAHAPAVVFMIPGAAKLVHQRFGIAQSTAIAADDGVFGLLRLVVVHRLPAGVAQRFAHAAFSIDCLGLEHGELRAAGVRHPGHTGGGNFNAQVFMPHTALDRLWHWHVDLTHESDALRRGERLQRHRDAGVDA